MACSVHSVHSVLLDIFLSELCQPLRAIRSTRSLSSVWLYTPYIKFILVTICIDLAVTLIL